MNDNTISIISLFIPVHVAPCDQITVFIDSQGVEKKSERRVYDHGYSHGREHEQVEESVPELSFYFPINRDHAIMDHA